MHIRRGVEQLAACRAHNPEVAGSSPAPAISVMNEHRVFPNTYIPDLGITYPEKPDEPMLDSPRVREVVFDANYPYWDRSLKGRIRSFVIYAGIFTAVRIMHPFKFGLKIAGKEHIRKNRALFKNGAVTISNHVYRWDFLAVQRVAGFRRLWFPAKKKNIEGRDAFMIRGAGGIPIPYKVSAMRSFNAAFDALHKKKAWIHVFPESCRWQYYEPIRPFKKGAFTLAYRYRLPVIPMAFSYRPAKGLLKLFLKDKPAITLNIGEPLLFDSTLPPRKAREKMLKDCHAAIVSLAGIEKNMWPATE